MMDDFPASQSGQSSGSNPRLRPCPDCGSFVSLDAIACPKYGRPFYHGARQDVKRKYPALRVIAGLIKLVAVVLAIGCVIGLVFLCVAWHETGKEQPIIPLAAYTLLVPISLWASGELILLFIDIEYNTRSKGK